MAEQLTKELCSMEYAKYLLSGLIGAVLVPLFQFVVLNFIKFYHGYKLNNYLKKDEEEERKKRGTHLHEIDIADELGFTPEYVRYLCFKSKKITKDGNFRASDWLHYTIRWKYK